MTESRPLLGRRHFLASAAVGTVAALLPFSGAHAATVPPGPGSTVSEPAPAPAAPAATTAETAIIGAAAEQSGDTSIRPFKYHASDAELAELKRRVKATKWPDRETVNDDTQGVRLATMQKLADHWANHHDWRRAEAQIFSYPNFVTNIDGLDIHFIHVKSKHPNALPLIITHGWPGSIIEQLKVIGPLTDPTAHGGTSADAFDVVIPSLPGYGFSGKPTAPGWVVPRIAKAWDVLMKRLGYTRYVAQGGDWGNAISEVMALQQPPGLLAIHTNMSATLPEPIRKALPAGPPPAGLSPDEQHAWDQLTEFYAHGLGYALEMNQRPQTLYALADSPTGLAAWILDHDIQSYELIARVFDGAQEGPDQGRHHRQYHALLADQHGGFIGAALLGDRVTARPASSIRAECRCQRASARSGMRFIKPRKAGRAPPIRTWSSTRRIRWGRISLPGSSPSF